ncbi:methyltransferase domain-containing protein [Laspinema olomoucense]|uniref:methyltransferase domain-containing protein n=1 Tax=Laspinema olomoucense TaxID=3231600 RepID=UPI0021BAB2F4|nr:methyltransferase domain-containing protein [Laspinema sp. D3a]MCT7989013.1 sulfotransferase [Laspinema sp. D3a]
MNFSDTYPVPPEDLRWRVVGNRDETAFLKSSVATVKFFAEILTNLGMSLDSTTSILDFGCGCGRILRAFPSMTKAKLVGCDTDGEAIFWCQENLSFAKFWQTAEYPPLPFENEEFDFLYGISVFTHLDEEHQFKWLEELKRVVKPGGLALLTFKGQWHINEMPDMGFKNQIELSLKESGFLFTQTKFWEKVFPDFYGDTYCTPEYIHKNWSKYFEVLEILPPSSAVPQYAVLLRVIGTKSAQPEKLTEQVKSQTIMGKSRQFIIICPARTGSTMLVHSLNSHPEIICHGEVMAPDNRPDLIGLNFEIESPLRDKLTQLREQDPVSFLYDFVLHPSSFRAVGFKFKYEELSLPSYQAVLDSIMFRKDVLIIHLTRKNLLKRYVSQLMATQFTNIFWISNSSEKPDPARIRLDPKDCLNEFKLIAQRQEKFRDYLKAHQLLEVNYEDLVTETDLTLQTIQDFLGVSQQKLIVRTKKVLSENLVDLLENFYELKGYFKHTKYETYFD